MPNSKLDFGCRVLIPTLYYLVVSLSLIDHSACSPAFHACLIAYLSIILLSLPLSVAFFLLSFIPISSYISWYYLPFHALQQTPQRVSDQPGCPTSTPPPYDELLRALDDLSCEPIYLCLRPYTFQRLQHETVTLSPTRVTLRAHLLVRACGALDDA